MPNEAIEVMPKRDLSEEERKAEARRVVHEFATYCVWHLSLTKPNAVVDLRILIGDLLKEWQENEFGCGSPMCVYCNNEVTTRNFRHLFRKYVGRSERGRI